MGNIIIFEVKNKDRINVFDWYRFIVYGARGGDVDNDINALLIELTFLVRIKMNAIVTQQILCNIKIDGTIIHKQFFARYVTELEATRDKILYFVLFTAFR